VVEHLIEDDVQAALAETGGEGGEIGERAVVGIGGEVVGNVVAVVGLGRSVDGRDPEGVDAEVFEVIEFAGDTGEIADAVAVGVGEAARINLVVGGFFSPSGRFGVIE